MAILVADRAGRDDWPLALEVNIRGKPRIVVGNALQITIDEAVSSLVIAFMSSPKMRRGAYPKEEQRAALVDYCRRHEEARRLLSTSVRTARRRQDHLAPSSRVCSDAMREAAEKALQELELQTPADGDRAAAVAFAAAIGEFIVARRYLVWDRHDPNVSLGHATDEDLAFALSCAWPAIVAIDDNEPLERSEISVRCVKAAWRWAATVSGAGIHNSVLQSVTQQLMAGPSGAVLDPTRSMNDVLARVPSTATKAHITRTAVAIALKKLGFSGGGIALAFKEAGLPADLANIRRMRRKKKKKTKRAKAPARPR